MAGPKTPPLGTGTGTFFVLSHVIVTEKPPVTGAQLMFTHVVPPRRGALVRVALANLAVIGDDS